MEEGSRGELAGGRARADGVAEGGGGRGLGHRGVQLCGWLLSVAGAGRDMVGGWGIGGATGRTAARTGVQALAAGRASVHGFEEEAVGGAAAG